MLSQIPELIEEIKNIFNKNIETTNTTRVPSRHDPCLTFTLGENKKGLMLNTCILMVDIRNSTKISSNLKNNKVKLGKIYSAFIHAMASIADEYGYVRNIVGDRVMVVFEPEKCCTKAIECATFMYTIAIKVLKKLADIEEFKIGIGIEYGEMLVLKTGIRKKFHEQSEFKGLVWVGEAANIASKLCDCANTKYSSPLFKITYERFDFNRSQTGISALRNTPASRNLYPTSENYLEKKIETASLTSTEFSQKVKNSETGLKYSYYTIIDIEVENRNGSLPPVLISGKVFNGLKAENPTSPAIHELKEQTFPEPPKTGTKIYGGALISSEIKYL